MTRMGWRQMRSAFIVLPVAMSVLAACALPQQPPSCDVPVPDPSTHTPISYLLISQRLGERGTTRLRVAVGPDGSPADVSATTSGSLRLDDAGIRHVKTYYRWLPLTAGCNRTTRTATIIINWWLDPLSGDTVWHASPADYPGVSLSRAEEGKVTLEIIADRYGHLETVRTNSSGYPNLDEKARTMVERRLKDRIFSPYHTEYINVIWSLPASAIREQKRKGVEIIQVHADALDLRAFTNPIP